MSKDNWGWGNDGKGEPIVSRSVEADSGGESSSGGGSGRVTQAILAIAMVLALGLAGYAMVELQKSGKTHTDDVAKLKGDFAKEQRILQNKFDRAKALLAEDTEYADMLKADSAEIRRVGRAKTAAPTPPARQVVIDALQAENAALRAGGKPKQAQTPAVDPFPRDLIE